MSLLSLAGNYLRGKAGGQLIVQFTDRCNAHCPQCSMRVSSGFTRSTLELARCLELIEMAASRGVSAISFTGGEPLMYPLELATMIRHAGEKGIPFIRTGTNGYFLREPAAPSYTDRVRKMVNLLANSSLRNFWISVDSACPETHARMRGFSGLFKGIEQSLPEFHRLGLYPTANLGINRNLGGESDSLMARGIEPSTAEEEQRYQEEVAANLRRFLDRVISLGFTIVNFCYPMSIEAGEGELEAVYPATAVERIVRFSPREKVLIFAALAQVIGQYRQRIRIFTPLSALYTMCQVYRQEQVNPFPCRGGIDYFFVSAVDGHLYPCGYRGREDLGAQMAGAFPTAATEDCSACDWECFRDPSELSGPLHYGLRQPHTLFTRYRRSREFYRLWLADLRYYRACDFFDGRRAPSAARLADAA